MEYFVGKSGSAFVTKYSFQNCPFYIIQRPADPMSFLVSVVLASNEGLVIHTKNCKIDCGSREYLEVF